MAILTETPTPEVRVQPLVPKMPVAPPTVRLDPIAWPPVAGVEYHPLFSESLLESGSPEKKRRTWSTTVSFSLQCVLIGTLLIMPLMFTEALPDAQLLTILVAPPPPPPPPPPAAQVATKIIQTDVLKTGQLRTPTRIPQKIEMIKEEEAPPPAVAGVIGGVPGGIPGGQLNGVIGGIISSSNKVVAPMAVLMPERIRVSQGVIQGQCIRRVEPVYPKIALGARVQGVVLLKAIISKAGEVTELEVVSGHPILVPAAMDAVKQWRYRPHLLNGEPVEVETNITVTFTIAG
jgi:periplasmic protein TonB